MIWVRRAWENWHWSERRWRRSVRWVEHLSLASWVGSWPVPRCSDRAQDRQPVRRRRWGRAGGYPDEPVGGGRSRHLPAGTHPCGECLLVGVGGLTARRFRAKILACDAIG